MSGDGVATATAVGEGVGELVGALPGGTGSVLVSVTVVGTGETGNGKGVALDSGIHRARPRLLARAVIEAGTLTRRRFLQAVGVTGAAVAAGPMLAAQAAFAAGSCRTRRRCPSAMPLAVLPATNCHSEGEAVSKPYPAGVSS